MAAPASAQTRWFVEELQPHVPSLRAYLCSRFPWLMDVDDIAQEALLRLWRRCRRNEFVDVKSPKAMLFTTARNAALDLGRRRAKVEIETSDIEGLADHADVSEAVSRQQAL